MTTQRNKRTGGRVYTPSRTIKTPATRDESKNGPEFKRLRALNLARFVYAYQA
jgi:hypothetical protein